MPHDKSIPSLNKERDNRMVYCFAPREKELEEQYLAVAWKEKEKSLDHKSHFLCTVSN